jgi:hypothetical protein
VGAAVDQRDRRAGGELLAQRLDGGAQPGATGTTKRKPGRARCISAQVANRRGAMYSISERRLPGSTATTVSAAPIPSAARLASRGTSNGIALAKGWPT